MAEVSMIILSKINANRDLDRDKIGPKYALFSKIGPKFAFCSKIGSKFIVTFCSKIGPKFRTFCQW